MKERFAPYREPAQPPERPVGEGRVNDRDLAVVFAVLWLGSVLRVAVGIGAHEVFGAEASAALAVACALPLLAITGALRLRRT